MKNDFLNTLASGRLLFMDGAMGTMLQAAGMPAGSSTEKFCLARPDVVKQIYSAYLKAGANILTTCTFGANSIKMPSDLNVEEFNCRMAELARQAIEEAGTPGPCFVAGDVGPTGKFARPLGDIEPGRMIEVFAEQMKGLVRGGCDLLFMETQFDLAEARAGVAAARQVSDLPVMVSMTFENGLCLTGSTPEIYAETMQNLDCDVIGTNCSLGPDEMLPVAEELLKVCQSPVLAQPNAGLPLLENGKTVFPLGPEEYAIKTARFAELGVQILGGCCGTTPAHIEALVKACRNLERMPRRNRQFAGIALTGRSSLVRIGAGQPLAVIGERINPTGKPVLAKQLAEGDFTEALRLAEEQVQARAAVLDVNVGAAGVDEKKVLPQLVSLLSSKYLLPLSLDSSDIDAVRDALPVYPGSCLVNSISGEKGRMEALGPLCRIFGAPFILLPLTGAQLPEKAGERIAIIKKLLEKAEALHIPRRLIMIDILALAVSSCPDAAEACLATLRWCLQNGLPTTLGLSNISFGLPARDLVNATFLSMGAGVGLSSCIANPDALRVSEAVEAINLLTGHDLDGERFIASFKDWRSAGGKTEIKGERQSAKTPFEAVLAGDRENILPVLEKELAQGHAPMAIINDALIPAINEVGSRYEKREYFLPQLIRSAETMRMAFEKLKPLLAEDDAALHKPVIVMATVEGDIHDIGKNIVSLLLGNHGFEVMDAGKDVPAEKIVEYARKNNASIIGLSALMTTTMVKMKETVDLIKKEKLPIKVMVGGAAVTREFADAIGADGYSEDAVGAVKLAKMLLA